MSDQVVIRPAKSPQDVAIISKLAYQIWRQHYTPIIGAAQVEYMLERFQSAEAITADLEAKRLEYHLVTCDHDPAGYMAFRMEEDRPCLFLSKFYVSCQHRGRGIGRAMLGKLIKIAAENDVNYIELTVNRHNKSSIAIYKNMGFQIVDSVCQDIGQGFVMDDHRLRLFLP